MGTKKIKEIVHHTDHEGEPKTIDAIRARANLDLVDIVAGPMKLDEVTQEIRSLVYAKSPEYVVVLIEKDPKIKKYHTTIYITKEDFKKK